MFINNIYINQFDKTSLLGTLCIFIFFQARLYKSLFQLIDFLP